MNERIVIDPAANATHRAHAEHLGRIGAGLSDSMLDAFGMLGLAIGGVPDRARRGRAEVEAAGAALGMAPAAVQDTIRVMLAWYQAGHGDRVSWDWIRDRLILRANGLPWQPPGQRM